MSKYFTTVTASVANLQRHKVEVAVETENIERLKSLAVNIVKRHYFKPTDSVTFEVSAPERMAAVFGGLDQRLSFRDDTGQAWIMAERRD